MIKRTRQEINKANAQKSTGPRTPEGRAKSSLCALRHGITSQVVVMPEEDMQAYKAFTKRYQDDFKPVGIYEEQLVQTLADVQWRLNRIRSQEHSLLALAHARKSEATITEHIEVHATLAQSAGIHYHLDELKLISMQEQRLSKQIRNAHKDLLEIQATRKAEETEALRDAAKLYQYHHEQLAANKAANPTPADAEPAPEYDPIKDGFVLQIPEIIRFIEHDNRFFRAAQAHIAREIVLSKECAPGCFNY